MATAPVKSQPLHNFSLPFLKWGGKNHANANHRFRCPLSGDSSSHPPPSADHASELDSEPDSRRLGSRTIRYRFGFSSCYLADKSHNHHHQQQQQQQQTSERAGNNQTDYEDDGKRKRQDDTEEAKGEAEEATVQKPWNLRPRKPFPRGVAEIGAVNGEPGAMITGGPSEPKSLRLREMAEMQQQGAGAERKEKRKLWIALSREEIEEDIFVITGSRPARRPKKRPKHVQKQLDGQPQTLIEWLMLLPRGRGAHGELQPAKLVCKACGHGVFDVKLEASLQLWEAE